MKTLYLCRHAKSSWKDKSLDDFERPLNKRGKNDAPLMGKILSKKNIKPALIISSPAIRAFETAKIFSSHLDYPEEKIKTDLQIYEASSRDLLNVLRDVDNKYKSVMLFGHNPGLNNLSDFLTGHVIDNIPTSGVVCAELNFEQWASLDKGNCTFKFFEYPKKYK